MRLIVSILCAAGLLGGCAGDGATDGGSATYVYDDWLYHHYDWYDDDFWLWVDDHPDCCDDRDDLEEACRTGTTTSTRASSRRCAIGSIPGWTSKESCRRPDSRPRI